MFEIAIRPRLRQRLRKLQPNNHSKVYSDAEISAIEKYLGVPPMVPVIILLIGTWITFYSVLSSESVERQSPVCAYQTNPLELHTAGGRVQTNRIVTNGRAALVKRIV